MKAKGRKHSIMRRMWIPLSFVMILQSVLFGGSILWGGTIDRLEQNSFEILNERGTNRKNYLENEMIQRWSDLAAAETLINQKVSNMLEQNQAVYSALTAEEEWTSELLELISPDLLHLMRRNSVTGAFVVFNGDTGFSAPQSGQAAAYSSVHFRDTDPVSTPSDYSDIMMERGVSRISKALGIPLDIFWTPQFCLDNSDKTYYEPFLAALKYSSVDSSTWDIGLFRLRLTRMILKSSPIPSRF